MPGSLTAFARAAALDALALLSPVDCAGCGRPDRSLCGSCRARLAAPLETRELAAGGATTLQVIFALSYDGAIRRIVLEFKQNGRTGLARALAPALRRAIVAAAALHDCDLLVVPVPPGRSSARRRGYDPVGLLLARGGIRATRALRMLRRSPGQKRLGIDERLLNRARSMRATDAVRGRRVVLVDDVVTTGATLVEAARAVREAGGIVVAAAALASTPRRRG